MNTRSESQIRHSSNPRATPWTLPCWHVRGTLTYSSIFSSRRTSTMPRGSCRPACPPSYTCIRGPITPLISSARPGSVPAAMAVHHVLDILEPQLLREGHHLVLAESIHVQGRDGEEEFSRVFGTEAVSGPLRLTQVRVRRPRPDGGHEWHGNRDGTPAQPT